MYSRRVPIPFSKIFGYFEGRCFPGPLFQNIPDISRIVAYEISQIFWKNGLQDIRDILAKWSRSRFSKYPGFFGRSVPTKYEAAKSSFRISNLLARLKSAKYPRFFGKSIRENARDGNCRKYIEIYRIDHNLYSVSQIRSNHLYFFGGNFNHLISKFKYTFKKIIYNSINLEYICRNLLSIFLIFFYIYILSRF